MQHRQRLVYLWFGVVLLQWTAADARQSARTGLDQSLPPKVTDDYGTLTRLNVKDADLRDVLLGIGRAHNLNLVVDNRVQQSITLRLSDLPVLKALTFICSEYRLRLQHRGDVLRITPVPEPPPPPPKPLDVSYADSLLSLDVTQADVRRVMRKIQMASGANIVVRQGINGTVTARLSEVPVEVALRALATNHGFTLHQKEGVYHVGRGGGAPTQDDGQTGAFWVQVDSGYVSLDVTEAPITRVLQVLGTQLEGIGLVAYIAPTGKISARVHRLGLEETLDLLLKGTDATYRREGTVYSIGRKQTQGIASTVLVRLDHLRADAALALVPELLKAEAGIQVVKEHNGLMVTGSSEMIREVRRFVEEVDHPTPQILIEALVVDVQSTDLFELGFSFGRNPETATTEDLSRGRYGYSEGDGFDLGINGPRLNRILNRPGSLGNLLGIHQIGRLPDDFYLRLHALDREGKLRIRSRPQVATLNGHKANISIGTTQYYLLNQRVSPFQQPGQVPLVSESQRFERIEANVKLEIVPWVSASGEVTAEIRPEFSTPVGDFDPDVPPTINSRVLESTVRLRDGETIILGGLIREAEEVQVRKVPFLGSIPLLGRLFQSKKRDTLKSELVIFITPYVFYGDQGDPGKWETLRQRLDRSGADASRIGYTRREE